ncbi:hypothetical protein PG993_008907 [Apiospora rasikravindrae]|uniref:Uncharacterized protein n=1 Tax=Apiospora rasikravindrae TaxID=990691 RepID=A0ABR1SPP1_9PEZI
MLQIFQASRNGAQNLRAVMTQVTGDVRDTSDACTRCRNGNGLWRQCVTASSAVRCDPIAGACANCFYNGRSSKCSLKDRGLQTSASPSNCTGEEDEDETAGSGYECQACAVVKAIEPAALRVLESAFALQAIPSQLLLQYGLARKRVRPGRTRAGAGSARQAQMKSEVKVVERSINHLKSRLADHIELVQQMFQVIIEQASQSSGSED